jgi:hypothetical protein
MPRECGYYHSVTLVSGRGLRIRFGIGDAAGASLKIARSWPAYRLSLRQCCLHALHLIASKDQPWVRWSVAAHVIVKAIPQALRIRIISGK